MNLDTIFHLSDIHVRLLTRHDEYRHVFTELHTHIIKYRQQYPNMNAVIIITGDIFHVKGELSPESIVLVHEWFDQLASCFPVFIIAGNHDAVLCNKERQDNLTAIFSAYERSNVYYLKSSGIYTFDFLHNIEFHVFSLLDNSTKWPQYKKDCDQVVQIALYHGGVGKYQLQNGMTQSSSESQSIVKTLCPYDLVLLGDIHIPQRIESHHHMAYAGSLIVQNEGERGYSHGYLRWNVKERTAEFITVKNEFAMIELCYFSNSKRWKYLDQEWESIECMIKHVDLPRFGKCTIVFHNEEEDDKLQSHHMKKILQEQYPNMSVRFKKILTPSLHQNVEISVQGLPNVSTENTLQSFWTMKFQSNVSQEHYQKWKTLLIPHINQCHIKQEGHHTQSWNITSLRISHLFGYGSLEMDVNHPGVWAIIGQNSAGKSTLIDILCLLLFGKCARYSYGQTIPNEVIHRKETHAQGCIQVEFPHKNEIWKIHRKFQRIRSSVHGIKIRSSVQVFCNEKNMTLRERRETDKFLTEIFGSMDDFLFTSCFLQTKVLRSFRDMTQKERKEFIFKHFSLETFESLYQQVHQQHRIHTNQLEKLFSKLNKHQTYSSFSEYLTHVTTGSGNDAFQSVIQDEFTLTNQKEQQWKEKQTILETLQQSVLEKQEQHRRFEKIYIEWQSTHHPFWDSMEWTDIYKTWQQSCPDLDDIHTENKDNKDNEENKENKMKSIIQSWRELEREWSRCNYSMQQQMIQSSSSHNSSSQPIWKTSSLFQKVVKYPKHLVPGSEDDIAHFEKIQHELDLIKQTLSEFERENEEWNHQHLIQIKEFSQQYPPVSIVTSAIDVIMVQNLMKKWDIDLKWPTTLNDAFEAYTHICLRPHNKEEWRYTSWCSVFQQRDEWMFQYSHLLSSLHHNEEESRRHAECRYQPDSCQACLENPFRYEKERLHVQKMEISKQWTQLWNQVYVSFQEQWSFPSYMDCSRWNQMYNDQKNDLTSLLQAQPSFEMWKQLYQENKNKENSRQSVYSEFQNDWNQLKKNISLQYNHLRLQEYNSIESLSFPKQEEINKMLQRYHVENIPSMYTLCHEISKVWEMVVDWKQQQKGQTHHFQHLCQQRKVCFSELRRMYHDHLSQRRREKEEWIQKQDEMKTHIQQLRTTVDGLEKECQELEKRHVSQFQQYRETKQDEQDLCRQVQEWIFSYLLSETFHRDGWPVFVLRHYLQWLEHEWNHILEPFMTKKVRLYWDEKQDDLIWKIQTEEDDENPIFLGGMETLMVDIAFKVLFHRVSHTPTASFFVMDETVSVLDKDHLSNLSQLTCFLRSQFHVSWIITHLENVRDFVDGEYRIEKCGKTAKSTIIQPVE